jgi:hypothetical protein
MIDLLRMDLPFSAVRPASLPFSRFPPPYQTDSGHEISFPKPRRSRKGVQHGVISGRTNAVMIKK